MFKRGVVLAVVVAVMVFMLIVVLKRRLVFHVSSVYKAVVVVKMERWKLIK